MNQVSKVEIPVEEATAAAFSDSRRREAVGRLIDRLVRPGTDDPLIAFFERTAADGQVAEATFNRDEILEQKTAYTATQAGDLIRVRLQERM